MDIRYAYREANSTVNWVTTFVVEHSGGVLWTDVAVVPVPSMISFLLTFLVAFILDLYKCSALFKKKKKGILCNLCYLTFTHDLLVIIDLDSKLLSTLMTFFVLHKSSFIPSHDDLVAFWICCACSLFTFLVVMHSYDYSCSLSITFDRSACSACLHFATCKNHNKVGSEFSGA